MHESGNGPKPKSRAWLAGRLSGVNQKSPTFGEIEARDPERSSQNAMIDAID
jgi:hypothetical protein